MECDNVIDFCYLMLGCNSSKTIKNVSENYFVDCNEATSSKLRSNYG